MVRQESPFTSASYPDGFELVLRRLQTMRPVAPEDMALLLEGCGAPEPHGATARLDGPSRRFLLSGWAARARLAPDGRRLIVGFILPGDPIDVADPALFATVALTRGTSADAAGLSWRLGAEPEAHGALRGALEALNRAEAVRHVDHVFRLGALEAYGAMAHLLLELESRCAAVGLADGDRFPMLVSQDVLGDALGLSHVHANRVLAGLRRDGLLELGPGWARLVDRERLAVAAGAEMAA